MKISGCCFLLIGVVFSFAKPLRQGNASQDFAVVSIKPSNPKDDAFYARRFHGALNARGISVADLIHMSYSELPHDAQILNAPDWCFSEKYDIQAKPDDFETAKEPATDSEYQSAHQRFQLSLRGLLADRFRFQAHIESRQTKILALVVGKHGPKFKEAAENRRATRSSPGPQILSDGMTMKDLAANVALETGRMVVDATGLTGYYEISLSWTRDQDNLAPTDSSQERVGQTSPSIYAALEQQLGLKLEPRREPVDVLVVDHVERPSLN